MRTPFRITFRDVPSSEAITDLAREKAEKLEQIFDRLTRIDVTVEVPHKHQHKGRHFRVRVELGVPGQDLVAGRDPDQHSSHEDPYLAVTEAFKAAERQLRSYSEMLEARQREHRDHNPRPPVD